MLFRSNFGWLFSLLERFGVQFPSPWLSACRTAGFPGVNQADLDQTFAYLRFCLEQICADMEMESLLRALDGGYVLPGPGGDPIRNPGVLPRARTSTPSIPRRSPPVPPSPPPRWWWTA